MEIKSKNKVIHTITVTEKELDAIQLAIGLMLENPDTHKHWFKVLGPIIKKMRSALKHGDEYEPIAGL